MIPSRLAVQAAALLAFSAYSAQALVRAHIDPDVRDITYTFEQDETARRGSIFDARDYALVRSIPVWDYHLDPVDLTNRVVRHSRQEPPRPPAAIIKTIARALDIPYGEMKRRAADTGKRYQFLARSKDARAHEILADSKLVSGVAIDNAQERLYLHGRLLSHVIGLTGLETRFDRYLTGIPGKVVGVKDARGHELYDRRKISIEPRAGADIYLTIDHNLQALTEEWLHFGITNFHAGTGWAMIMDAHDASILSMASYPDYDPVHYATASDREKLNRAIGFTYEPGSVMKVITAASCLDAGFCSPRTLINTDRFEPGYYKLPGDAGHHWDPMMSVSNAIVHSSNIVIGKLGFNFGAERLWQYLDAFGFGRRTGLDLPGEEAGILRPWQKWDKASCSRVPIGQAVSVTALQLISAYQAIANDGVRMQPHLVRKIVGSDDEVLYEYHDKVLGRPIGERAAREMRTIMRGVASREGTARRAAIKGYSVSGKTGTAQKSAGRAGYIPGLYRATFCAMVPSEEPSILVLVTLDFDTKEFYHQGGNSSGVVFQRLATEALRYLMVPSDRPEELLGEPDEVERAPEILDDDNDPLDFDPD